MEITAITVGEFAANCYVVGNEGRGIVIDPGSDSEQILAVVDKQGLELEAIINTHGHFDHIGANGAIKDAADARLYIHRADERCLRDAGLNLSLWTSSGAVSSPPAECLLSGGELLELAGLELQVLHTPGHSPGSICLSVGNALFTGDTLFAGSIGRVDFPGSSGEQLIQSLRDVILPMAADVVIYPGHGPASTLGAEKQHNLFLSW
ncbi:MAG: MBL fold metallo-hydrolase [Firmicutes bacterium]|nr:MBL fold metallo-hydrolase [Bacillota bacterium]